MLADDRSNTLWVCQNNTGGRGGAPVVGQTALRSFDLKSGVAGHVPLSKQRRRVQRHGRGVGWHGLRDWSFANRIHRLKPGAKELDLWVAADPQLAGVDGIAILADGSVYVNTFFAGKIFRIPVKADGSAGALEPIDTSQPFTRPDGLRSAGPRR